MGEWCDTWLDGYRGNRDSTVRQAETHIKRIKVAFGSMPIGSVRPSHVRTWCAQLSAEGLEDSYVYALHARLAQIFADAVHDGLVAKIALLAPYIAACGQAEAVCLHDRADVGAP